MRTRVAINGFGRIGRTLFRQILKQAAQGNHKLELVAINDLGDLETLAHLLEFDTVHGRLNQTVQIEKDLLIVGNQRVAILSQPDIEKLPWHDLKIDVVVESTGIFTSRNTAGKHLAAGSKKVVISAPGKDVDQTICLGINDQDYDPNKHHLVSNASCTTNCLAPLAKVLHENFSVTSGLMTTVHSYTNDQRILDLPHKDLRRARAAAANMIPTTTGAAKAIGLVIPELSGKLHGIAVRVPTPNVSLVDLVVHTEKPATVEAVNQAFKNAAAGKLKSILEYCDRPLVSSDFNGSTYSCSFDAEQTTVLGGHHIKVLGWYDNETGYSTRLMELVELVGGNA